MNSVSEFPYYDLPHGGFPCRIDMPFFISFTWDIISLSHHLTPSQRCYFLVLYNQLFASINFYFFEPS